MAKAPAMQFYVRDWLTDVQLRQASPDVRGVWIDCLCLMWLSPEKGRLTLQKCNVNVTLCNGDVTLCNKFVTQLKALGFGDYEEGPDGTVIITNRRMYREFRQTQSSKARVAKYRAKKRAGRCNADVTLLSASASAYTPPVAPPEDDVTPAQKWVGIACALTGHHLPRDEQFRRDCLEDAAACAESGLDANDTFSAIQSEKKFRWPAQLLREACKRQGDEPQSFGDIEKLAERIAGEG